MKKILITDGMDKKAVELLKIKGFEIEEGFLNEEDLKDKVKNIDAIVVRSATKIRKNIIDEAVKGGRLKLIVRGGVGMDNIDVDYARKNGITVRNTPFASSNAVAELVLCEMLVMARKVKVANMKLGEGIWDKKNLKGTEIFGKTVGIIGFGNIARKLAEKVENLGMKVVYNDFVKYNGDRDYIFASIDEILETADYITVHTPLNETTRYMFNEITFKKMKNTAFFINCARGGIVKEDDLLKALEEGQIAGAAIDCFENEPQPIKELLNHPKVSVTPHIGASTIEAQERIGQEITSIVEECLLGEC